MTFEEALDQVANKWRDSYHQYYGCWHDFESSCFRYGDISDLAKANREAAELYARSKWDEGAREQLILANKHCVKLHNHVLLEVTKPEFKP